MLPEASALPCGTRVWRRSIRGYPEGEKGLEGGIRLGQQISGKQKGGSETQQGGHQVPWEFSAGGNQEGCQQGPHHTSPRASWRRISIIGP